jgi:hypothetical protein
MRFSIVSTTTLNHNLLISLNHFSLRPQGYQSDHDSDLAIAFCDTFVADAQEAFSYVCVKTPADNPKQRISTTFKLNANSLFIFSDVSHKYIDFCAVKAPCRECCHRRVNHGVFDWVSRNGKRIININRIDGGLFSDRHL